MPVLTPNKYAELQRDKVLWGRMVNQFKKPRIVLHKDSKLIRVIHLILKLLTRKHDFEGFTTTVGRTMYVPNTWYLKHPNARYKTLVHERIHMLRFRRWPLAFLDHRGVWRVNAFLFGVCYLAVLPFKVTLRAKFEREGYTRTLLVMHYLGELDVTDPRHRMGVETWMENTFGTGTYFWMSRKGEGRRFARDVMDSIAMGHIELDEEEKVTP